MKILHLSDTHGSHRRLGPLPEADKIVFSGDFCMYGTDEEAIDFLNWFCDLPSPQKIFTCGNHDECLYGSKIEGLDANVHYLCNSGIEIEGMKFYGVPFFNEDSIFGRQERYYADIPADTDVLITHSPAWGILDFDFSNARDFIHYGSEELFERVMQIKPRAHLFGHIHRNHGIRKHSGTIFSNGAIMNDDYSNFNQPNIIEL